MSNYLEVVRTVVPNRIHWLAEKHPVVNGPFGKVKQLGADDHQRLAPFAFDFVGLSEGRITFFWWITGNISVLLMIRST